MTPPPHSPALKAYVASRFATNVGGSVYASVGPLIAALMFGAGPAQIGLITATSMATNVVLRLPVAHLIDRRGQERSIMVRWGLLSALVSSLVPLLWLLGGLTFWSFLACIALSGVVSSVLSAAGHRMVSALAAEGERTRAIGLLNSARSAGDIVGQSTGGLLVGLIPPPLALLFSSAASLIGVALLPRTSEHKEENASTPAGAAAFSVASTMRAVRIALTRPFVLAILAVGIGSSLAEPVVILYLLNEGGVHPSLIGLAIGMGAVGGVIGGLLVGPVIARYGFRLSFALATACIAAGTLALMVVAPIDGWGFVAGVAFELMTAAGGTIAIAGGMGRLQEETPRTDIARTMSGVSLALEVTGIAGIGVGVLVAEALDLHAALLGSIAIYVLVIGATAVRAWLAARR